MSLPDFIVIGAMKCGTSTLAAQLGAQPGFFMTTPKEPNFFSDDNVYLNGENWYRGLFASAGPDVIKGEASTHYTKLPTYPQTLTRMQKILTNPPRLVYMIRNPVVRAVSHFMHDWSEGQAGRDIGAAFERSSEFVDYGCYGMQIAPFIAAWGQDNVYLTSLEMLKADPAGELSRVCAFLGHTGAADWQDDKARENASATRVRKLPAHRFLVDHPVATYLRRSLVPKPVRTWIRERQTFGARPELPEDLRARLEERFLADRVELARFFPGHQVLETCYPFAHS